MACIKHGIMQLARDGDVDALSKLMDEDVEVDWAIVAEEAAVYGRIDLLRFFVERGVDMGDGIVYVAVKHGRTDVLDFLMESTTSANDKETVGKSAAIAAIETGRHDMLKFVIDECGSMNKTVTEAALVFDNMDAMRILLDSNALIGEEAIEIAANGGNTDMLMFLVDNGVSASERCIEEASKNDHMEMLTLLVDVYKVPFGETSVLAAALNGRAKTLQFLLDHCAQLNNRNAILTTVLESGYEMTYKYLCELSKYEYDEHDIIKEACKDHVNVINLLLGGDDSGDDDPMTIDSSVVKNLALTGQADALNALVVNGLNIEADGIITDLLLKGVKSTVKFMEHIAGPDYKSNIWARVRCANVLRLLMTHCASEIQDSTKHCAIRGACMSGDLFSLKVLLETCPRSLLSLDFLKTAYTAAKVSCIARIKRGLIGGRSASVDNIICTGSRALGHMNATMFLLSAKEPVDGKDVLAVFHSGKERAAKILSCEATPTAVFSVQAIKLFLSFLEGSNYDDESMMMTYEQCTLAMVRDALKLLLCTRADDAKPKPLNVVV